MKFTHNQKVKCTISGIEINDAKISIDKDGRPFICQNFKSGSSAEDKLGYDYSWGLLNDFTDIYVSHLCPAVKSFDCPEVGDQYKDKYGDTRTVLGVIGELVGLSSSDKDNFAYWVTKKQLATNGYTIIQDEPEEEVEELTVSEICKRLGKTIKIKKD